MTNEVHTVTEELTTSLEHQTDQISGVMHTVEDWLMLHGVEFLVNLAVALLILAVGACVIRILTHMGTQAATRRGRLNPLLSSLLRSTINKSLWAILIIIVLKKLGIDVTPLVAGLGVTGFILGFAFQESLGNLASGTMLAINQPFKIGDYVEIGGNAGTVRELNMMATTLTTPDNKQVVIPNKVAWGAPIINYSTMPLRQVQMQLSVSYGSDLNKVKSLLVGLLDSKEYVKKDPGATVEVNALSASSVDFIVRPWVDNGDYWKAYFELTKEMKELMDREGIEIPFPQVAVTVRKEMEEGSK